MLRAWAWKRLSHLTKLNSFDVSETERLWTENLPKFQQGEEEEEEEEEEEKEKKRRRKKIRRRRIVIRITKLTIRK
jgi:hypothetical protein